MNLFLAIAIAASAALATTSADSAAWSRERCGQRFRIAHDAPPQYGGATSWCSPADAAHSSGNHAGGSKQSFGSEGRKHDATARLWRVPGGTGGPRAYSRLAAPPRCSSSADCDRASFCAFPASAPCGAPLPPTRRVLQLVPDAELVAVPDAALEPYIIEGQLSAEGADIFGCLFSLDEVFCEAIGACVPTGTRCDGQIWTGGGQGADVGDPQSLDDPTALADGDAGLYAYYFGVSDVAMAMVLRTATLSSTPVAMMSGAMVPAAAGSTLGACSPRPGACTREHVAVCGCNGVTYPNACAAHAAGTDASGGACRG